MIARWSARTLLIALAIPLVFASQPSAPASALSGADFDPGNVISDAAFYDGGAMTATQVQQFLSQMVPTCQSGYTCLKDYRQNTPSRPADAYCGAMSAQTNETAASIIARVGIACGISQKVLLVLLQKEQSLVTHVWPSAYRFDKATGFACPDTAACDPSYSGFFYQVYYAARQFQRYASEPTRYNYRAARVNNILYHPNIACGSSSVYIVNSATAGLYNYTPYRPNSAALNNLYGLGDGCSSYGNRNFWRIYSDWFGSPTLGTSLLRTVNNSTVYLVTDTMKYPIPSIAALTALAPLGSVGYVSSSYLDRFTTGPLVGRAIRDPAGTIYFYDRGTKLPFQSCGQLVDYGYSCAPNDYLQLTDAQAAAFVTGPVMTSVIGTTTGERYFISAGTRAEILDDASQTAAGLPTTFNVLSPESVSQLVSAAPVVRDGVFIRQRGTSTYILLAGGASYTMTSTVSTQVGASARAAGNLSASSVALLPAPSGAFSGVVTDESEAPSLLDPTGRWTVTAGGFGAADVVDIGDALLATYSLRGELQAGSFVKAPSNGTIFIVMPDDIRPISSWGALLALTPDGDPQVIGVSDQTVAAFSKGPVALTAGTLYRSPGDATVFFIDGVSSRVAFSSFIYPVESGFNTLLYTSQDRLDAYPLNSQLMSFGFACGDDRYVGASGALHLVSTDQAGNFPLKYVDMDQFTCGQMKIGTPAVNFIRLDSGSIYQLVGSEKRKVMSMARLAEINAGLGWITVSRQFAALYSDGPAA